MVARRRAHVEPVPDPLPALRFEISEAALILRMSRAQIYTRIQEGSIKPQKDGARTYITRPELERYVESCNTSPEHHARAAPDKARRRRPTGPCPGRVPRKPAAFVSRNVRALKDLAG
jgi:hypothetical protein